MRRLGVGSRRGLLAATLRLSEQGLVRGVVEDLHLGHGAELQAPGILDE